MRTYCVVWRKWLVKSVHTWTQLVFFDLLLRLGSLLLLQARVASLRKPILESLDATLSIDVLHLSCVERMALRADIDFQLGKCAPRLKRLTATAGDGRFDILWMNAFFHGRFL